MIIGTSEIFVGLAALFFLAIAYIAHTLIKQLHTLEGSQARRILDLMVIGAILYWLNVFVPKALGGQTAILSLAGMLIFLYGYGLLLLEKYREGRREAQL